MGLNLGQVASKLGHTPVTATKTLVWAAEVGAAKGVQVEVPVVVEVVMVAVVNVVGGVVAKEVVVTWGVVVAVFGLEIGAAV